jgi:hypothetical protein
MADKLGNCRNLCSAIWGRWHSKISGHQHEQGGECQGYLQVAPIAIPFSRHDGCIALYCTYCTHQYFNPLYFTSPYFTLLYYHQSVSPPISFIVCAMLLSRIPRYCRSYGQGSCTPCGWQHCLHQLPSSPPKLFLKLRHACCGIVDILLQPFRI